MNKNVTKQSGHIKLPIRRSLLFMMVIMFVVLCVLIFILSSVFFRKELYSQFDSKLTGVITYIENNIDADDLKTCLDTGEHSEKYDETQQFLNNMIDDLNCDYIYIVIPSDTALINAISATNAEERAAGEEDLPLLMESYSYSPEELAKYRSYWNAKDVNFFEETSEYGTYYTGIKPLRDSGGETVALICVDLLSSDLQKTVWLMVINSMIIVALVFGIFGVVLGVWLNRYVTKPLRQLENAAHRFSSGSKDGELKYEDPGIKCKNEIGSLAFAIRKMTNDIDAYIDEKEKADLQIRMAEEDNLRLAEKAAAAAKISELSQSVSDLLNNMPALSFCKDPQTGKYIACNQAFAKYAGKTEPYEVIGLTDFEIFDEETAKHFSDDDKKAMGLDCSYILLETVPDAHGEIKTLQTTKLKFKDASGETRLLGMCVDLTEMSNIRRESEKAQAAYETAMSNSITYSGIARALSMDYSYIYYVNIESDDFAEYKNDNETQSLVITRRRKGFFDEARERALTLIHKDDCQEFIAAFTKENVLDKINTSGTFTATYRQLFNGVPVYVNMKATRIKEDPRHIVIGIYSVDVQMKYKETIERMQEEQTTYARISALSGDFICIYTVDPETDHFSEYSAKSSYEGLGIEKEGDRFFEKSRSENIRAIWYEDREMYLSMFSKENVLKEIKEHGMFALNYRLDIFGAPLYVMLKAAIVEEKDGPKLIVGVSNIDAQVKREKEYDYNLSVARSKANVDALTGVKNKHAYIDAEAVLNVRIEEKKDAEFAIVVFDVNGLKHANDTKGHRAGDDLIRGACAIICNTFKHSPVFRVGGDEFAVIAQGGDYQIIDELVSKIAESNRINKESDGIIVACGMSKYKNERNVAEVFEKADKLMYENKHMLKGEKA